MPDVHVRAQRGQLVEHVAEPAESLPDTVTPRAIMIRAIPDMPAPPMPVKCTRPRSASGTGSTGVTSPMSAHRARCARWARHRPVLPTMTSSTSAASHSSLSRAPMSDGRLRHRRDQLGVEQDRQQDVADPLGGQRRVVDDEPAAARAIGSAFSRCSPLPCGSGTYAAGRPTAVSSAQVIAPLRHSAKSAAA